MDTGGASTVGMMNKPRRLANCLSMKLQDKLPESSNARVECFFIRILQNAVVFPSLGDSEDVGTGTDVAATVGQIAAY